MKERIKNLMKKKNTKISLIIGSIVLVLIAIFTTTYSLFYGESVAANPDEYSTGLLVITAISKSETISLNDALPMSDEDGANTEPYTFTIKNIGNLDYKFDIKLLSTGDVSSSIDAHYIKVKIDDNAPVTLYSLTNSIIKSNVVLSAQKSMDVSIRVWLDINTPNSQIGKTFTSQIVTEGQAVYTSSNYDIPKFTGAETISNLFNSNDTVTSNGVPHQVDTAHQLIKDSAGNIRYYGTGISDTSTTYVEPSNYIDIGDRDSSDNPILWRIIGVFDGKLKLIRSTYITSDDNVSGFSWDTSASTVNSGYGINQWGESGSYEGADLMRLLNPKPDGTSYEGINGSLYWNSGSGTCYNGSSNTTTSCNFTNSGLSDSAKDKIADVTWNTGGWSDSSVYPNLIYEKERGTTVISSPSDGITRTTSWTGKIGLAYPSDYGYATDLSKCTQTLYDYDSSSNNYACRGNNWMWYAMTGATSASSNGSKNAWLLTPHSSSADSAWRVSSAGYVSNNSVCYAGAVSPVLYLKQDVLIDGGNGTSSNPYIAKAAPQPAVEVITNLYSKTGTVTSNSISHDVDTTHQLIKDPAGNIRYYGTGITDTGGTYKEPNNYINIGDNVLWRIIGVFDGKLKLIRSSSIGDYSWDTSANTVNSGRGVNEWSQADLMKLLNPGYENNQDLNSSGTSVSVNDSLWYNSQSGTCYYFAINDTTSCNFTSTGLSNSVKNKIADVTWNTGGWNTPSVYPNLIYEKERGTTVYTGTADGITRTTSWTGKIGLAYPSDYGYATDLQHCTQNLRNYDSSTKNYACRGNNWMWYAMTGATTASSYGQKDAWLLTPYSGYELGAWAVAATGYVYDSSDVYRANAVSPVLYLNSEQIIESGSGTSSDPYVLSA